jgi:hypothetical protein
MFPFTPWLVASAAADGSLHKRLQSTALSGGHFAAFRATLQQRACLDEPRPPQGFLLPRLQCYRKCAPRVACADAPVVLVATSLHPVCPIFLQAPMSDSVRQFLITSLQNGFFGNPSTPNAIGQVTSAPPLSPIPHTIVNPSVHTASKGCPRNSSPSSRRFHWMQL